MVHLAARYSRRRRHRGKANYVHGKKNLELCVDERLDAMMAKVDYQLQNNRKDA